MSAPSKDQITVPLIDLLTKQELQHVKRSGINIHTLISKMSDDDIQRIGLLVFSHRIKFASPAYHEALKGLNRRAILIGI